jgi:hypothetical protein
MNRKMQEKIFRKATNVEITFIFFIEADFAIKSVDAIPNREMINVKK